MKLQTGETKVGEIPVIRNIVLAVDASQNSMKACEAASILARGFKASVKAVYVLPKSLSIRAGPLPDEEARVSLERAVAMLASFEGATVSSQVIEAKSLSISEALLDYISEEKSDLVICGHRGTGGFEKVLLGSVSNNLVTHCPTPVLVVRAPAEGTVKFDRILVGTDGSESAWKGVILSTSFARALSSKLTFANVIFFPPISYTAGEGDWYEEAIEGEKAYAQEITSKAKSFANGRGVDADVRVIDDMHSPVESLTNLAQQEGYGLITIGTRGLSGFQRALLGSVASGVAHYAHCSVLVAR